MHYFNINEKLQSHVMDCEKMNDFAIKLPSVDDKWLEFENHCNKQSAPFIVYADLECVLRKMELERENASSSSYTHQQHEVFSIGYYVRCSYNDALSLYRFRRDEDCITWFARQLNDLAHQVKNIVSTNVPMETLSKEQLEAYCSTTRCHICEKPFMPDDTRVRDHCHLTGRFRGPAHANCNLNYKNSFYIPIIFHNLSGYDAHFIIKEIATAFERHVNILPITKEKYISFTKNIDSTKDTNEKNFRKNCIILRFFKISNRKPR